MCEFFKRRKRLIFWIFVILFVLAFIVLEIFYIKNHCWQFAETIAMIATAVGTIGLALVTYDLVSSNIMDSNDKKNAEISAKVIYPLWRYIETIQQKIQEECDVWKWKWGKLRKEYAYLAYDPAFNDLRKRIEEFHKALSEGQRSKNKKNSYNRLVEIVKKAIESNEDIKNKVIDPIEKTRYGLVIEGEKVNISFFRLIFESEEVGGVVDLNKFIKQEEKNRASLDSEAVCENKQIEDKNSVDLKVENKEDVFKKIGSSIEKEIKDDEYIKKYIYKCKTIFDKAEELINEFEKFFNKIK